MTGLVLCGGQSSRMGEDKGLLMWQNRYWVELAAEQLATFCDSVLVSVSSQQLARYSGLFANFHMVVDDPKLTIGGPLKGLLSAHRQFEKDDLMVLACDMPLMEKAVLQRLSDAFISGNSDAYVFKTEEGIEPLCAIYTAAALRNVHLSYTKGNLAKYSMHAFIHSVNTCFLILPNEWRNCFRNFNSPDELTNYL